MKLILLRHGESQWNLENRFTGWKDVSLTKKGIQEANFSGNELLRKNIKISSVYTSLLKRAVETAKIVTDIVNFPQDKIKYDWRLNERHYGSLQGLNKSETAKKYGEEQVHIWRRSYDIPPPPLNIDDKRHSKFNEKFNSIKEPLPNGESLKNVIDRLNPFWYEYISSRTSEGNHLIVAHSNSLRAIIKILDKLSDSDISSVNIPTGVPLIYECDEKLNVLNKKYLISNNELQKKIDKVVNQGKVK